MLKLSISKVSCWVIAICTLLTIIHQGKWKQEKGYIFNDAKGYYAYLPATIIHQDWSPKQIPDISGLAKTPDGKAYTKYTSGTAICQTPTFILAHLYALVAHHEPNGYSTPYQIGLAVSALLFLLLSLFLARKLLLNNYSESTTSWTLLLFYLGTNYLHYNTSYLSYSHIYSVFFILLFIHFCMRILEAFNVKNAVLLGFTFGMMTLIRPVDGIFIFVPLLLKIKSWSDLKKRLRYLLKKNLKKVLVAGVASMVVWVPQLIYNYSVFNRITINSYQGERFFFADPEFFSAIFSFNNGWLIYSPLMAFSVIGLFISIKNRQWIWPIIFILYVYVISSWWCWWYVGFGNRAFVNLGAFLLFPTAACIQVLTIKRWVHLTFGMVVLLGISLNFFQNQQFENGAIHFESMTWKSYQSSWLRPYPTFEFFDLLQKYDTEAAFNGVNARHKMVYDTVYQKTFQTDNVLKIQHFQQYFGLYEFPKSNANTFVAEAWCDNDPEGLSFVLETMPKSDTCSKSSYGITTVKKIGEQHKMRVYYRFNETQLNCVDSIRAFFSNDPKLETNIRRVEVTALSGKDTLIYLE